MGGGIKQYKLVLVEWVDSLGCSTHWSDMDGASPIVGSCYSVGFLVAETDDALLVVPHIAFGTCVVAEGQGCGDMSIPRSAVTRVVELSETGATGGDKEAL